MVSRPSRSKPPAMRLDLSDATAKLARARVHFETLQSQSGTLLSRNPFAFRMGKIDKDTGWQPVYLTAHILKELQLSPILGDLVHNLRSTLNYIVTALALASGAELSDRHEFPIFNDRGMFRKSVLREDLTPIGPKLKGITIGLEQITAAQPFDQNTKQSTPPYWAPLAPLWSLYQFSNADKHRQLSQVFGVSSTVNFEMWGVYDTELEALRWEELVRIRLEYLPPNTETEIIHVRHVRPLPSAVYMEMKTPAQPMFMAVDVQRRGWVAALNINGIRNMVTAVDHVLTTFRDL